jgi:uncharacterized protein with beta-barrel porin domain
VLTPEIENAYAQAMSTKAPVDPARGRYNAWITGYGGYSNVSGEPTVGSNDTHSRAAGTAAGFDYRVSAQTVVGFALGGATTRWDVSQGGNGRADVFQAAVYASHQIGAAYISGVVAYGSFWTKTDRTITIPATDTLSAKFTAQSVSGRVEGGYRLLSVPFGVTPYAAAQVNYFHLPAFTETSANGGAFATSVATKNTAVVRTEVGTWFDDTVAIDNYGRLYAFARLAYAHDFNNDSNVTATFVNLPAASFVVNGAAPASNLGLATLGAELRMKNGWAFLGKVDGEFGDRTQTYSGTGRIRYTW